LVTVALQGDYGKPRPALIVQADQFVDLGSIAILPLTSHMVDAPLLRMSVSPTSENGLRGLSQIMLDKPMTVKADKIGQPFGHLDDTTMVSVNRALALFLGLAG
jgi:mRNA interferase MazF